MFRTDRADVQLVLLATSRAVYGLGALMLIPALVGFAADEVDAGWAFVLGAAIAAATGAAGILANRTTAPLSAGQALAAAGLVWFVAPLFAAVPLVLSGHYASFLDAWFEATSGLTTGGLTLVNDLDHLARSVNLWRHMLLFIGGQAIVAVVLTTLAGGLVRLRSQGEVEGRDELRLPDLLRTARIVARIAAVWVAAAIGALWLAMTASGYQPATALRHAVMLGMGTFSTGGFAPTSASVAAYRSPAVEMVLIVTMVAGAVSFAMHHELWGRGPGELRRSTETRTLAASILTLLTISFLGLARSGTFPDVASLVRHGLFQAVSSHTTTGLQTVPSVAYVVDWGALAPGALVAAMAIGGMAGSTAGGIKGIRLGLVLKGVHEEIRRVLLPDDAVVVETYHAGGRRILRPTQVRDAAVLLLLFLLLYVGGSVVGLLFGYTLEQSLFESTAAASTGGLSLGIVRPVLEWPLKVVYLVAMVMGRVEYLAVLALLGLSTSVVRGRV